MATSTITPLTDLIVANVASQVAATLYSGGAFASLTPAALSQAEANLRTRLQPLLAAIGLDSTTDLLRAVFNANHAGQDALLDILRVTVDPVTAQATILNIINNQQIVDDLATQTDVTVADGTGVAAGLTEIQQIVAKFDAWTALYAASLPAPDSPQLLALFDPSFLWMGETLAVSMADMTSDPKLIGVKFTNVSVESLSASTAKAKFVALLSSGTTYRLTFVVNKVNGVWLLAGDQRILDLELLANANYRTATGNQSGPQGISTGFRLIFNPGSASPAMHYAVITGKGLPTANAGRDGLSPGRLYADYGNGRFGWAQGAYNGINTARLVVNGVTIFDQSLPLSDARIDLIGDNETYTVKVYADPNSSPGNFADDVELATYTEVVGTRPYKSGELTAASFPAVSTTVVQVGTFARNGGTLTVNWTQPTGLKGNELSAFRGNGQGNTENVETEPAGIVTSANLTWLFPAFNVQGNSLRVRANDVFNRGLQTVLESNQ